MLQDACTRAEVDAVSFWVHVPHYANNPPCPKATLALLHRVEEVLDLPVPMADLAEESAEWEQRVRTAAEQDAELAEYVRELEERVGDAGMQAVDRRRDRPGVREVPAPPRRLGRPHRRQLVSPTDSRERPPAHAGGRFRVSCVPAHTPYGILGPSDRAINPGAAEVPAPADRGPAPRPHPPGRLGRRRAAALDPRHRGEFGVAKQTVQRTIDQLRVEGVLITKPGSGTFVRGTRRRLNRLSRGRYGGHRGYHADLAARYRQHLELVGRAAGAAGGRRRLRRLGRHRAGRTPAPGAHRGRAGRDRRLVVPGHRRRRHRLERSEAFGRPLYQEAEEATGRPYASATDTISARQPSREEAEILQIRPDTPVLHLLHVAFDARHGRSRWRRRPGRAR